MIVSSSRKSKFRKFYRFYTIYGFSRSYIKAAGRLRVMNKLPKLPISFRIKPKKNIAIIGAGQFAFATIGYFLKSKLGNSIFGVFDIDIENSRSLSKYYKSKVYANYIDLLKEENVKYVYVASNHASHTLYAIEALNLNKIVYVEKPISVTFKQYESLIKAAEGKKLYVGYNRPFSPAIMEVRKYLFNKEKRNPISINYFITGHKIPKDHWYRNYEEGTRVCGNIGHWLDLTINLFNVIGLPKEIKIDIHSSSKEEKDDNLTINMVTDTNDIISIMLSSREEPFEGINESINIQYSNTIVKIDDFRRMTIWNDQKIKKHRYFRKDVGHKNAILQPFEKKYQRDFEEVKISTKLMLEITNAVRSNIDSFIFYI